MVYPSGPVSHERHPMLIFQEWEAMGLFDIVSEDKVEINRIIVASNSSHIATASARSNSTKLSTPLPDNISKDFKRRVSYVSKAA